MDAFEKAVIIRKELEERIRQLEKLETTIIGDLKHEFALREAKYQESILLIQEDYDRFKRDAEKEVYINNILTKRAEEFNTVLRKELVVASNIIKTPILMNKVQNDLNNKKIYSLYAHNQMSQEVASPALQLPKP